MRRIQLLRHAKSSWDDPDQEDIDRPLNKRGKHACKIMAQRLPEAGCCFDAVFCSPAKRARSTIKRIASRQGFAVKWQIDKRLYTFDSEELFTWLQYLDDSIYEPLIVGHNPALTDLCNRLAASSIDNIPTCAYVSLLYEGDSWQQLRSGCCRLEHFLRPRD